MDNLLKFFGLDRRKGQPETALEPADYSKKLDEWLKENIPRREEKISLRKKAWDLTVLSLFVVGTLYFYKKDIHKFPKKRDQRKYKFFTGSVIAGLGILIYSRWTDDGFYRRVEVAEETEDSFLDVRLKYVKEKLFPPETKDMYDKYVQGKESKSEESSSTESKKSSDSEKSS